MQGRVRDLPKAFTGGLLVSASPSGAATHAPARGRLCRNLKAPQAIGQVLGDRSEVYRRNRSTTARMVSTSPDAT